MIAIIYAKRANTEFDVRAKALVEDAHNIKGVLWTLKLNKLLALSLF